MPLKSMHNDFDFLLLGKKDDGLNIERTKKINEKIIALADEYVLYGGFPTGSNTSINLIEFININFEGVIDGEIKILGGAKFITLLKRSLNQKTISLRGFMNTIKR